VKGDGEGETGELAERGLPSRGPHNKPCCLPPVVVHFFMGVVVVRPFTYSTA